MLNMPTRKRVRLSPRRKKNKKVPLADGILAWLNCRAKPQLKRTVLLRHKAPPPPMLQLPQSRSPSPKIPAAHTLTTLLSKRRRSWSLGVVYQKLASRMRVASRRKSGKTPSQYLRMGKMNTWPAEVERPSARSSAKRRRGSMSTFVTLSLTLEDVVEVNVDEDVAVAIEATSEAEVVDAAATQEGVATVDFVVVVADATAEILPTLATRMLSRL